MKRNFKAILTVFTAAVLAFNLVPVKADAATELTAYLAYGNSDWTVQWGGAAGTSNTEGATGVDATVTGVGQYTVSVDFTGTAVGMANGAVAFTAPIITNAATELPGYFIDVDAVEVNGASVDFAEGYTNDEDGHIRSNLCNTYVGVVPDDARSLDGDPASKTWLMVDPTVLTDVETLSVTFTVYDAEGNGPAAEEPAVEATTEEPATEEAPATDVPKTGVVGLGLVYGLGALATGAAALRRKQK